MKIEYAIYCKEHDEELTIVDDVDNEPQETLIFNVKPCSQCMSESYEKGIESLLSKGWPEMKGEP